MPFKLALSAIEVRVNLKFNLKKLRLAGVTQSGAARPGAAAAGDSESDSGSESPAREYESTAALDASALHSHGACAAVTFGSSNPSGPPRRRRALTHWQAAADRGNTQTTGHGLAS